MSTSSEQHQIPDRNGLVQQGLIGDHMVRVTCNFDTAMIRERLTRISHNKMYYVTIGLFHKYGNTSMNPRHRQWTSRHKFSLPQLAWEYGVHLVSGAINGVRND